MATITRRPTDSRVPPSADEEREEQPSLEGLRQVLRAVIVVSVAAAVLLAVFPVFGPLGLLPALVAVLAYAGNMLITRVEHRRWKTRHLDRRGPRMEEVGFRVVAGGESSVVADHGDATVDQEPGVATPARPVEAAPAEEYVRDDEMFSAPQRAGARVALTIAAIMGVLALGTAALIFDLPFLGVGLVLALCFMALFGMSVWLASVEDAAEAKKQHRARPGYGGA